MSSYWWNFENILWFYCISQKTKLQEDELGSQWAKIKVRHLKFLCWLQQYIQSGGAGSCMFVSRPSLMCSTPWRRTHSLPPRPPVCWECRCEQMDSLARGRENTGTGTPHDGRGDGQLFPKPRLFFLNFTYHFSYPRVLRSHSDAPPQGSMDKGKQRKEEGWASGPPLNLLET